MINKSLLINCYKSVPLITTNSYRLTLMSQTVVNLTTAHEGCQLFNY